MARKESRKIYCSMCSKKTQNGATFCSKECEEEHYDYIMVTIPSLWIKETISRIDCTKRMKEIRLFAARHNANIAHVIQKIQDKYKIELCKENN